MTIQLIGHIPKEHIMIENAFPHKRSAEDLSGRDYYVRQHKRSAEDLSGRDYYVL